MRKQQSQPSGGPALEQLDRVDSVHLARVQPQHKRDADSDRRC
jgi:hypothetical protein